MGGTTAFLLSVAPAVVLGSVGLALPGFLLARIAGLGARSQLLLAPILGAASWGTASCLVFHLLPYRRSFLIGAFLLFSGGLYLVARRGAARLPIDRSAWALSGCSLILGALSIAGITPIVKDEALFIGAPIYDHAKAAIVDSIAREGLPPVSPYYHPGREVRLDYYYLWHFLASQLRVSFGLSGWEADAALTWLTYGAVLALVAAIVIELRGTTLGAVVSMSLLTTGSAITGVILTASRLRSFVDVTPLRALIPWRQDIQTAAVNAAWAPQHTLAAGAIVLALLVAADLLTGRGRAVSACVLGALLACTVASSAWVALAAALAAPAVVAAFAVSAWRQGLHQQMARRIPLLVVSVGVALVLAAPVLFAMSGTGGTAGLLTLAHQQTARSSALASHVMRWWLHVVPAVYGATLLLGLLGLLLDRPSDPRDRLLRAGSCAAVPSFLLVSEWLRSSIGANDLGWRAHVPSYLVLAIFAGVAVSFMNATGDSAGSIAWPRWKAVLAAVSGIAGVLLIAVGLVAGDYDDAYRVFIAQRPEAAMVERQSDLRRDLLTQQEAWTIARSYGDADAVIQSNPDGYAELTPFPVNLPYMLFADRTSAIATADTARVFARRADPAELERALETVRRAFQGDPDLAVWDQLAGGLGVDVLLVDRRDPLFQAGVPPGATAWHEVHAQEEFRIYAASGPRSSSQKEGTR